MSPPLEIVKPTVPTSGGGGATVVISMTGFLAFWSSW
uniref:Uncharacterized protein n=1 Tax=Arundo donax TaxID=35708 RepID=A0A0A9AWD1_ARUDO